MRVRRDIARSHSQEIRLTRQGCYWDFPLAVTGQMASTRSLRMPYI